MKKKPRYTKNISNRLSDPCNRSLFKSKKTVYSVNTSQELKFKNLGR